jgi:hypothetical protein
MPSAAANESSPRQISNLFGLPFDSQPVTVLTHNHGEVIVFASKLQFVTRLPTTVLHDCPWAIDASEAEAAEARTSNVRKRRMGRETEGGET